MQNLIHTLGDDPMKRLRLAPAAFLVFALMVTFAAPRQLAGQDEKTPYPSMAPVDQYLMEREAEIALARSAAPEDITRDATVLALGRQGYEVAVQGKNGFVCVVERSFMASFESPEFWNPKNRSPDCYNPAAARSVLPVIKKRAQMVLAGLSKEQMVKYAKAAKANKEFPPPDPGAMAYMMSKQAYLSDKGITADGAHTIAHVMFFIPTTDAESWGANSAQSPMILLQQSPESPTTVFIVAVGKWSDGTPAPLQ